MSILYHNPEQKTLFEENLNPLLREEIKRFLFSSVGAPIRAVESANLLESDTNHLYDEIWMVTADPEQQIERLMEREQLSRAEARYHVDAQWDQQKKAHMSKRVIDNSSSIQQTESQVRKILDELNLQLLKIGL
jgi:dephospho-CoA kinase